jgi:hypothetical protein
VELDGVERGHLEAIPAQSNVAHNQPMGQPVAEYKEEATKDLSFLDSRSFGVNSWHLTHLQSSRKGMRALSALSKLRAEIQEYPYLVRTVLVSGFLGGFCLSGSLAIAFLFLANPSIEAFAPQSTLILSIDACFSFPCRF